MAIDPVAVPSPRPPVAWSPLSLATSRCKGCELCVGACAKGCLALDLGVVNVLGYHPVRLVDASACTSCAFCARVCPDAVFTVFAPPKAGRSAPPPTATASSPDAGAREVRHD